MSKTEELRKELNSIVDNKRHSESALSDPEVVRRALEIEQLLNLRMSVSA